MVGLILSVAKGAFGDLFRALGLASILAVRRSRRLSAEYPFLPYARRALAMRPRRPFPPAENPWKYKKSEALAEMEEAGVVDDSNLPAEFSMAKVCTIEGVTDVVWMFLRGEGGGGEDSWLAIMGLVMAVAVGVEKVEAFSISSRFACCVVSLS